MSSPRGFVAHSGGGGGDAVASSDVAAAFDRLRETFSEAAFARAMLTVLDLLERGRIDRETADQLVTCLDRDLTAKRGGASLSEEAQELIFEGEHLHHFGEAYGPDPAYVRRLARTILDREGRTSGTGVA